MTRKEKMKEIRRLARLATQASFECGLCPFTKVCVKPSCYVKDLMRGIVNITHEKETEE